MKVVKLADVSNDNKHITPKDLIDSLVDREDIEDADKALVILVRGKNEEFSSKYYASKMDNIEMVAYLMECIRDIQDEIRGGN